MSSINSVIRNVLPGTVFVLALVAFGAARADSQQTYLQCLTNFETYAESIWHPATYSGAPADSGYWGDGSAAAGNNGGIRGNGGVAVAYAVLVVALPGDARTATRLSRIRQALNYNAATHFTGANLAVNGVQWGWNSGTLDGNCSTCNGCADWQSAEWTGSMGLACLLTQTNLPAATVQAVQRVVASEADHRASVAPCSLPLSSGDTKAEENGWDGNPLALAAAWLSASNNAPAWLSAAQSYLANTYTVANTNGDPLASVLSTVTLYPSYALENHGFYHPTYEMVAAMSSGDSLLMARLANPGVAAQLQAFADHNVSTVWNTNLSCMLLDNGEFAYPSGLDWDLHDYEHNSYITWMAAHLNDPVARWADGQLVQLVRYRQLVNGNGMFVGNSGGGFYREAVEARRTAIAWLHWANADFPTGPTTAPAPAVLYCPDVGVISQRSASGFVSISYKDTIMGMVEAASASVPTNVFVATPALPGGFGHGPLGNPTSAALLGISTNDAGFAAQLLVQNGANGSTRVYVTSTGESVAIVEVPLPANGVTGTVAGCFTNGIENDPLTGGSRLVEWGGGSNVVVNAMSGTTLNITNKWVCVAGRYGLASGPGGYFRYRAATSYNRAGAAQDYLHVMPQTLLGARYAVWFPGKSAAQIATLAANISWTTNGSVVVLSFPGATGSVQTITASLTSGNGAWSADASGNWSDPLKWSGGNVADGGGFTADFSTLNITADRTVTLDSSRSVGALKFGDTAGAQNWMLNASGGSVLTLSATTPAIVVNQNTATISAPLAGTAGFTKSGAGTLVLSGSNSLSGAVLLDSGSTSASDGAVRVTSSAALANASSLSLRNNSGVNAASTLQLDGSLGNLVLTQDFTNDCRANLIPNVENLAGSNTLSGSIYMQTGGSNVVFQSDSGTLLLSGPLQYIGTLPSARWFNFFGSGDTWVSGSILFSSTAPLGLGKYGTGTLTLRGANGFANALNLLGGTLNFAALNNLGAVSTPLSFTGATLQYAPGNSADISGRTVTFNSLGATIDTGTNDVVLANGIGGGGTGSLTKTGSGSLALNGVNNYTGGTVVSNGSLLVNGTVGNGPVAVVVGLLRGVGSIGGPVTVSPNGTLAPGNNAPGVFTINNAVTNVGVMLMRLNKTGALTTNDVIKGVSTLACGGTLQLASVGDQVTVGDSFKLFFATNYQGAFAALVPATPGPGLTWSTNNLYFNGTVSVALGTVAPYLAPPVVAGTNLILSGGGGAAGYSYSVLSATNLTVPLTNWLTIGTGICDSAGHFAFTNSIDPSMPQGFWVLRIP